MPRGVAAAVLALVVTAVEGASATESTIYPGVGIGKVKLGMTRAQVQRALGKYRFVNERSASYLSVGWGFGEWSVAFRNGRVVLVATTLGAQRTAKGIGSGSTWRALVHAYSHGTCWGVYSGWKYVVARKGGLETVYKLHEQQAHVNFVPVGTPTVEIYEVDVRSPGARPDSVTVPGFTGGTFKPLPCSAGWQNRDQP